MREAIRCGVPLTLQSVEIVQTVSWSITAVYCAVYLGHVIWCHRNGYALNPVKYAFLASSYFMWYFVCSTTESFLVYTIAHRLTHGLQYIVIVHLYLQNKTGQQSEPRNWLAWLVRPRHIFVFVASGFAYAVFYQLMTRQPLADFGFGVVGVASMYGPIPEMGMPGLSEETAFELFATVLLQVAGPIHYYFDSFIWKVRDHTIQEGL